MKIQWDEETRQWNIMDFKKGTLMCSTSNIRINVPCELVTTSDCHGHVVVSGSLIVEDDYAIILKG